MNVAECLSFRRLDGLTLALGEWNGPRDMEISVKNEENADQTQGVTLWTATARKDVTERQHFAMCLQIIIATRCF